MSKDLLASAGFLPQPHVLSDRIAQAGQRPDGDKIAPTDHFIIDLDGTLICGNVAAEGASMLLRAVEGRYVLVSNNSRDTASSLGAKLKRFGLDVPVERIILAGEMTVAFVARQYPSARCLVAASATLRKCARRHGLQPVNEHADVVILGRDTRLDYAKLGLLANEVRRGAILIAANPDFTHPGSDGVIVPETGTLMAAVEAAAGVAAHHVIGKPAAPLFLAGLERLGSARADTIVVGDNPLTDGAGAEALGMRSLIVHPDRGAGRFNLVDLYERLKSA